MRNFRATLFSSIGVLLSCLLFYAGANYMHQSIVTGAIERQVAQFGIEQQERQVEAIFDLSALTPGSRFVTAHDLNIYLKLLQWEQFYIPQAELNDEIERLLRQSLTLRPTWAPTYIESYKQAELVGDDNRAEKYLSLATKFAPYAPEVVLTNIDAVFSDWNQTDKETKIEASKQLVFFATQWQHKQAFNEMITYSAGKGRICRLLAFNKLAPVACSNS